MIMLTLLITPLVSTHEPPSSLSMGEEHEIAINPEAYLGFSASGFGASGFRV